jgi:murein DD-endopeptidase MepM/ murein hydrolase activator NlpD
MALVAAWTGAWPSGLAASGPRRAGADETTVSTDPTTSDATTTTDGSTSTSAAGSTTSTTGTDESTTTGPGATTTTAAGTTPTTLPADAGTENDVGSSFGPQAPFNPASKVALPAAIAAAKKQQAQADHALAQAQAAQRSAQHQVADLDVQTSQLSPADRSRLARTLAARQKLVDEAVAVYMEGGAGASVNLLGSASPSDLSWGLAMLDSVLEHLSAQSRSYGRDRASLNGSQRRQLDHATQVTEDLASATSSVATATQVDQAAGWQLQAFENASHVWVPGFIFPVEGPTRFTDTFGDARLSGTAEAHWHEGCDVMAVTGTPLVAVEDGVLTSYGGGDPLGGLSLFLKGTSGYSYYYAHLSAFAPGLAQGDTVTAGEVIGFVGSTGDAAAPHVHFEIHDPDGQVLDSYGLLKTAWAARQAQLGLPGGDPASPPAEVDPGTPGGFPRAPDGSPVGVGSPISPDPPD